MERKINEKGYALIVVLALITITSIFMLAYLNTFLHDTQEMQIEASKNQNNYTIESALNITDGLVTANKIMTEEELEEIINLLELNSEELFNQRIITSIDKKTNQIIYVTDNSFLNKRANSKTTIFYQTFNLDVFEDYKIVISQIDNPESKISGNNSFKSSYLPTDILGISYSLFTELLEEKILVFQNNFINTEQDLHYSSLNAQIDENLLLNSLWVEGNASIEGKKNSRPNIIIDHDVYIGGDFNLNKLGNVIINGDLVVYGGSLNINSVNLIDINGSLIVDGSIKIMGSPEFKANNISASEIQINSNKQDVFYSTPNNTDDTNQNMEYLDGQFIIESWKVE